MNMKNSGLNVSMNSNGTEFDCGEFINVNFTVATNIRTYLNRYQYCPPKFYLHFCDYCSHFISLPSCTGGDTICNSVSSLHIRLDKLDGDSPIHFSYHICVDLSCWVPLPFDLAVADWSCGCVPGLD